MTKQYRFEEKREMIVATMDKFPGRLIHWGDFMQRLHGDFGAAGLGETTVYEFMRKQNLADFSQRPFRRLV